MSRMDDSGMLFLLLLIALLVGLAAFLPSNRISGYVVAEEPCQDGACLELCDDDATCTAEGAVCCTTLWESGVCDVPAHCARVYQYSEQQSLEIYQDSVRDEPGVIQGWTRFFFPIVLTFMVLLYFILRRKNPHW